jgi:hypothetical protein
MPQMPAHKRLLLNVPLATQPNIANRKENGADRTRCQATRGTSAPLDPRDNPIHNFYEPYRHRKHAPNLLSLSKQTIFVGTLQF